MPLLYKYLFHAMWFTYIAYWWAMSWNVKPAERTEALASRFTRMALIVIAGLLLGLGSVPFPLLNERFLPSSDLCFWSGAAITAAGLLFSVWARHYLGGNWSQAVTVKEDHELIQSGPYSLVRHPIYTGLLVGFIGSAVSLGEWRGILAVLLVGSSFWRKLRTEERGMRQLFGERYLNYERRVSALIPFLL